MAVGRTAPAMPASTAVTPATTTSQTGGSVADTMPAEPTSSNAVADFPTVVDPLVEALRNGRRDLVAQRLTIPPGDNAFENFRLALRLDPHNRAARKGIADIAAKYVEFAGKSLNEGDVAQFNDYLDRATGVLDPPSDYDDVLKRIADVRRQAAAPLIASAGTAAAAWNKVAASAAYRKALQLDPGNRTALDGLKFVATIGQPGFVFHDKLADASAGPPMVILPGAKVAMARHEITRGEFRRYWRAGGRAAFAKRSFSCRDRESIFRSSRDRDWQRPGIPQNDSHPVVCVTWLEAAAYARWLGKQTGRHYRLPSPGELTALERKVPRGPCKANLADAPYNHRYNSDDGSSCSDGFAATAPVDRFGLVDGISDIDGNVREWSAACGDGSPVPAGGSCRDYLVQGRGWLSRAGKEPATFSDTYADDVGLNTVGFRVVRDLGK